MTQEQAEKFWKAAGAEERGDAGRTYWYYPGVGCVIPRDGEVSDPTSLDLETLLDIWESALDKIDKTAWGYRICGIKGGAYTVKWLDCLGGVRGATRSAAVLSAICALVGVEMD